MSKHKNKRASESPYIDVAPKQYRVLFTSGDELITPDVYRGTFEQSLQRALANTSDVGDEFTAKAFAVSVTANACTEYRATTTAGIPLKAVDPAGNELEGTPLSHFLTVAPNLLADVTRSLMIFGRFYLRKLYNVRGFPTGLQYLNPLTVDERDDGRGRLLHYDVRHEDARIEQVRVQDVIYASLFDPRPFGNGLSKFEAAWIALNIEQSVSNYAAAFFVNGAQADGFLTFDDPLTPDEFEEAKQEWKKNHKGAKNAHRTAVMPGGAKWTPTSAVPKDLAMIELKDAEREDICAVFEVDPILVGLKGTADPLSANSTYGTSEVAHLRRVTLPFLRMIVLPALNAQWALRDFDPRGYYTLAVDESAIAALSEVQLTKSDTAINLSSAGILDYAEARDLLGYGERDAGYLLRAADAPLSLWQAGALTMNGLHKLVFGQDYIGANGDVILVGGQLLPVTRLAEIAAANADKLLAPAPAPFGLSDSTTPAVDALPAPAPTPQLLAGGEPLTVALRFGAQADLVSLQQRVHGVVGEAEWVDPHDFHVTLFHAPAVSDLEAGQIVRWLGEIDVPDLVLGVGGFHAFDDLQRYALHFRVRRNADLLDFQETVYEAALSIGVQASAYSSPAQYIPHITMGYSSIRPRAVSFGGKIALTPTALVIWRGKDSTSYERSLIPQAPAVPAVDVATDEALRSALPLEVAVTFADHQFVRYARRQLSDVLTAQGVHAVWVDEGAWRLVLARTERWSPTALATLIRAADYTETRKVDARLTGYEQRGDAVYVRVEGAVEPLQKAVGLDLRAAGLTADTSVDGILLCTVDGQADGLPALDFPVVLNNVSLMAGANPFHVWTLRAAGMLESKELTNYLNVMRRKGRDHSFTFEYLPQTVRDYLQVAIADGDDFDALSMEAQALLAARAYADTRAAFVSDMVRIIGAAQRDDVSRQQFGASMRSAIRQHGLVAFRDGMKAEGYDPESFSPKELAAFRAWQAETSGYITAFGSELFKEGGISEAEVAARADAWGNKTLRDVYYRGSALAKPDKPKRWKRNPQKDSCSDCIARDGQVMTFDEWEKIGLPGSSKLSCHGDHCGCDLVDAD